MISKLKFLQKNLVYAIPIAMLIGIVVGNYVDVSFFKHLIVPVTFIMVYPMMASLNFGSIFKGSDLKLQIATQLVNFIFVPFIAYWLGKLFFSGNDPRFPLFAVGLFLIGVLPTSGMTISWTGFAKGNTAAATKMVVLGLIIGSLAAPLYTKIFMGTTVEVDMLHMFQQIFLFIFVPMIFGIVTQKILIKKHGQAKWEKEIKHNFGPFASIGVILIAFVAISLKAKGIIANPQLIIKILAPLLLFYISTYVVLTFLGKIFSKEDAVAMVFGVVMRDLSIALAIAMTAFGKEGATIALLISIAYVVQIQSAAWYIKILNYIAERKMKPALETI